MFKLIVQSLWFCSTCLQTAFAQEWRKFSGSPEVLLSDFSPCPGISALARLWIPTRFQCGNARWKNHSLELQVSEAKLKTTLMHAEASRWEYFNNFWKYLYISFCFSWTLKYFSVAWDRARWTCVPCLERGVVLPAAGREKLAPISLTPTQDLLTELLMVVGLKLKATFPAPTHLSSDTPWSPDPKCSQCIVRWVCFWFSITPECSTAYLSI